tara:strand:+ start:262 stop:678 length:417 start_codon:yes stop_codon:yes gene_type:complete
MIDLYLSGYGYSKKLCREVIEWFSCEFLQDYDIELEVLHRGMKREGAYGYCDISGETENPKEFLIEIDTYLDKEIYIKTIIHEMYHLLQWVQGELKLKSCKRYFRGECVEDLDYREQPHEIHARFYENVLYRRFLSRH